MGFFRRVLLLSLVLAFVPSIHAQNPYSRSFPVHVGDLEVGELVVSFEDVLEVGEFSVSLSSHSPSGSILPGFVLPHTIPVLESPLFVTLETTTSFRGTATVSLRIFLFEYDPNVPLRLFCATGTPGSQFRDITAAAGRGSMYASGYRHSFSEFVIGLDLRALERVIATKLDALTSTLESYELEIEPERYRNLRALLWAANQAYLHGSNERAVEMLSRFNRSVQEGAGLGEMPDTYNDPSNPAGNVAGDLFARSQTTIFSLKLEKRKLLRILP